MREKFWELPLETLDKSEWEALCDGCGKCCLNKIEDEDTGEVALTRVSCRLLDGATCRCTKYQNRHKYVPECIVLTPEKIAETMYWLPATCAYRLRAEGRSLYSWHHLLSGDPQAVHRAGVSMAGRTVPETQVDDDDWEDHVIEEPV